MQTFSLIGIYICVKDRQRSAVYVAAAVAIGIGMAVDIDSSRLLVTTGVADWHLPLA